MPGLDVGSRCGTWSGCVCGKRDADELGLVLTAAAAFRKACMCGGRCLPRDEGELEEVVLGANEDAVEGARVGGE